MDEGEEFVEISTAIIQKAIHEKYCDTEKEACVQFMEQFFVLVNSRFGEYVDFLATAFKYRMTGQESAQLTTIK